MINFPSFECCFSSSFSNIPGFGSPIARCDVECVPAEKSGKRCPLAQHSLDEDDDGKNDSGINDCKDL